MMFKIYLSFAEPFDQYLGIFLAGLLPNESSFAYFLPHLNCGMENQYISEAMNLCFKGIISQNTDPFQGRKIANSLRSNKKAFILRCLAAMVHHSGDLKYVTDTHLDHPFAYIPIFTCPALLS